MVKDTEILKNEMDGWVKDIKRELEMVRDVPSLIEEHSQNIDHNYELLLEMRSEITRLKEDVSALRLIQLLHLEAQMNKVQRNSTINA